MQHATLIHEQPGAGAALAQFRLVSHRPPHPAPGVDVADMLRAEHLILARLHEDAVAHRRDLGKGREAVSRRLLKEIEAAAQKGAVRAVLDHEPQIFGRAVAQIARVRPAARRASAL